MDVNFVREVLARGPSYSKTLDASEDLCRMVQCNVIGQDWVSPQTLFRCSLSGYAGNFACDKNPPDFCLPYCREKASLSQTAGAPADTPPDKERTRQHDVSSVVPSRGGEARTGGELTVSYDRAGYWQREFCEWTPGYVVASAYREECPSLWWFWLLAGIGAFYVLVRRS